jgi:transcriptional regulator with XRE-family HTH domain
MEFSKEETTLLNTVGETLESLRIDAGYKKPTHFAKAITMDPGQYVRYERGENMTIISLIRLLSHHNLTFLRFVILVIRSLNKKPK